MARQSRIEERALAEKGVRSLRSRVAKFHEATGAPNANAANRRLDIAICPSSEAYTKYLGHDHLSAGQNFMTLSWMNCKVTLLSLKRVSFINAHYVPCSMPPARFPISTQNPTPQTMTNYLCTSSPDGTYQTLHGLGCFFYSISMRCISLIRS